MTLWNGNKKQPMPRVAVIGTGTMGTAMALRLVGAGMNVDVWSRHAASTMPLVTAGATSYDKASDAVKEADVVITMLPTAEATIDVMLGGEALSSMRPRAVWAQMATIGIRATEDLVTETQTKRPSVTYVDAPVSGSRDPAEKGQLLILASGPASAAALLEPVFEELGRATLWLGPAGAGSRMKLVLNTWLAFQAEGAAEAAALAEHLEVPTTALFDALRDNPLASPYALGKLTRMIEQDYHADFSLSWALKDLDLAGSEAGPGVVPVADAIGKRWRGLVTAGLGGLDVSAARQGLGDEASTGPGNGVPNPSAVEIQTASPGVRQAVPVTP